MWAASILGRHTSGHGYGRRSSGGIGERAGGERVGYTAAQRRDLPGIEQTRQRPAGVPVGVSQVKRQPSEVRGQVGGERLARKVPDHRPQLVVNVEA